MHTAYGTSLSSECTVFWGSIIIRDYPSPIRRVRCERHRGKRLPSAFGLVKIDGEVPDGSAEVISDRELDSKRSRANAVHHE